MSELVQMFKQTLRGSVIRRGRGSIRLDRISLRGGLTSRSAECIWASGHRRANRPDTRQPCRNISGQ
jgi:hypothetical protein